MSTDHRTQAMAGIALLVAAGASVAPTRFLRVFGVDRREVTGTAAFGWRLFAMRNVYIGVQALRGNTTAQEAFLPIQFLDQAVFWHAFATRSIPRRASLTAAATSGVIIALDLSRRHAREHSA